MTPLNDFHSLPICCNYLGLFFNLEKCSLEDIKHAMLVQSLHSQYFLKCSETVFILKRYSDVTSLGKHFTHKFSAIREFTY